ncbi:hypothetical protein FDP41_003975 [Naegleria fowleri]|uniref:EGF-like domain-containing protein n=1 Tax=Naegleria fowleri TaxID=5763 RepID=A0A6A5BRK6_NAEFO|nr:uncharacterized protein FDP41_003975 [Naegleria fowleri]KAF0977322.1 hypothetical protein FDP41_003975 [Naegleria fowleri]
MRRQPILMFIPNSSWRLPLLLVVASFFLWMVSTSHVSQHSFIQAAPIKYRLSTIAGVFSPTSKADGPVSTTQLDVPFFVVEAPNGDLYMTERFKIRKISNGNVITVAGDGLRGYSGDGGSALMASINLPGGMTWLPFTNELLFADTGNNVLRMIDSKGIISTVGGLSSGIGGFNGDGSILRNTQLSNPEKLIFRNNTLYIADKLNLRIRKVSFQPVTGFLNQTVSTVAGNGKNTSTGNEEGIPAILASIDTPYEMAFDSTNGDMYIADYGHNTIRKVSSGIITTVAGGGVTYQNNVLATLTTLDLPQSVAVSVSGEIFIADCCTIRKISKDGMITTIAGKRGSVGLSPDQSIDATNALLNSPQSLFINKNGEIVFSDHYNSLIRKLIPYCPTGTVMSPDGTICLEYCYGILQNMTNVCSGNGVCSSNNTCQCSNGYFGSQCQFYTCFGTNSSDANVCSKHGTCMGFNNCTCQEGWTGNECSIPVCIPVLGGTNQTVVCSNKVISGTSMYFEQIGSVNNLDSKNISLSSGDGTTNTRVQVIFPPSISKELLPYLNDTSVSLMASIYQQQNFTNSALRSPLISITVLNTTSGDEFSVQRLNNPISLIIPSRNLQDVLNPNLTCVYYDVTDNSWKQEGVSTIRNEGALSFTCLTNHLTTFGVIDVNYKKASRQDDTHQTTNAMDSNTIIAIVVGITGSVLLLGLIAAIIIWVISIYVKVKRRKNRQQASP